MKFEDMINNVILGDCYEVIKNIPAKSIDCIYTDIPYLFADGGSSASPLSQRIKKLKQEDLKEITKGCNIDDFCMGCFTGKYPIEVPKEIKKDRFEEKIQK